MLRTVLLIILILALCGAFPAFGYNRSWGYAPFGGIGLIVVVLLLLIVFGVL